MPSNIMGNEKVFMVGCKNPDMKTFDISFTADKGSTYNSYLLLGDVNVLIDGVRADFASEQLDRIEEVIPAEEIDYILVNHTEPDHSGSLPLLLEKMPKVKIISSRCASIFLKSIIHKPFEWIDVKAEYILDLGWDKLRIISAPFLHWPDTVVSCLESSQILFSCDAFGAHYCPDDTLNTPFSLVEPYTKYYVDCIIRPFKSKVRSALSKIENIPIKCIAPSHGPIHKKPQEVMSFYKEWSKVNVSESIRVLVIYSSTYGYTQKMAQLLESELLSLGAEVVLKEIIEENIEEIRDEMEVCQGLLIGTPTIVGDAPKPVWDATCLIHNLETKFKAAAVFGSFGWSGEACDLISERLKGLKVPVFSCLKIRFSADAPGEAEIKKFGVDFLNFLKEKCKNKSFAALKK